MKKLYIVRHAKSSWADGSIRDFDRPLNKRGLRDAPKMGEKLSKLGKPIDLIISSPANRAKATAEIIANKIDYPLSKINFNEDLYLASSYEMITIINSIAPSINSAMLVAHNPGMTDLVNVISGYDLDNMPTCGICIIKLFVDDWKAVSPESGETVKYLFPKML
jgi:phosphohistidine phosphatase